jgi:AmiR/NasT family two-component response regulator
VGVVMATGMQDEAVMKEATSLGAYAYVLKPFDLKYLDLVVMTRLLMAA